MAVVVDTDVVSYLFKADSRARWYRPRLARQLRLVSFMSLAELDHWALAHHWGQPRQESFERFLQGFEIVYADRVLCRLWAEVTDRTRRKGSPMDVADAWIAATALALRVPLVTHNTEDYANVDGLTLISEGP
jgi:predicted nucleic acid-binding protein